MTRSSTSTTSRANRFGALALAAALAWPAAAGAQEPGPSPTPAPAKAKPRVRRKPVTPWLLSATLDVYAGGSYQTFKESTPFNPGNNVYRLSKQQGFLQLRSNDLYRYGPVTFEVRPRGAYYGRTEPETIPQEASKKSYSEIYSNESFVQIDFSKSARLVVGRNNFQWGPAELLSPSNFLFPDLIVKPEPYYEVKGLTIARFNYTAGPWTWVTIAELQPLKDYSYELDPNYQEFSQQRLLTKIEATFNGDADAVGLTLGSRVRDEKTMPLAGLYATYTPNDAWQVYTDTLLGQGSDTPEVTDQGVSFARATDGNLYVFSLAGVRYTFVDGTEVRLELIHNQFGFSKTEQSKLLDTMKTGGIAQLAALGVAHSQRSPLYGQNYVYGAVRWLGPARFLGIFQSPIVALRGLYSVDDGSSSVFSTFEGGLTDNMTFYAFAGATGGAEDTDLRRLTDGSGGIALKYSF